jgi:calcineurin-like phosphoesterase family protein
MCKRLAAVVALILLAGEPTGTQSVQLADTEPVVFVGAGDIANCENLQGARATARLLESIKGTVFTLGDHAYPSGSWKEFRDCYGPTWGRFKARTRPAIGNHDLVADDGRSYFDYFGDRAGPKGRGYYSFDLGSWHIISLSSSAPAGTRSPQVKWLREDLATHPRDCTLAYWHVPRFSSGARSDQMADVWRVLYESGADVVLSGHDHDYERFAPQNDKGKADPDRGIREFIVGTGGGEPAKFGRIAANSEAHTSDTYGVLKLTLTPGKYAWEFIPAEGKSFHDSGTATCSPAR